MLKCPVAVETPSGLTFLFESLECTEPPPEEGNGIGVLLKHMHPLGKDGGLGTPKLSKMVEEMPQSDDSVNLFLNELGIRHLLTQAKRDVNLFKVFWPDEMTPTSVN